MKKIIFVVVILMVAVSLLLTACGNHQLVDATWHFNYAIIKLPNGEIVEGECTSWRDYENSDQLQVKVNGVQYLTHSCNVVLEHR